MGNSVHVGAYLYEADDIELGSGGALEGSIKLSRGLSIQSDDPEVWDKIVKLATEIRNARAYVQRMEAGA